MKVISLPVSSQQESYIQWYPGKTPQIGGDVRHNHDPILNQTTVRDFPVPFSNMPSKIYTYFRCTLFKAPEELSGRKTNVLILSSTLITGLFFVQTNPILFLLLENLKLFALQIINNN